MVLQCFEGLLMQRFARNRPTGCCRSRESSSACVSETIPMTAEGVGLLDVEVASASLESESESPHAPPASGKRSWTWIAVGALAVGTVAVVAFSFHRHTFEASGDISEMEMPWPYVMDMDKEPVQASGYEKYSSFICTQQDLATDSVCLKALTFVTLKCKAAGQSECIHFLPKLRMLVFQADNKSSVMEHLPKLAGCCTQLAVDLKAKAFRQDAAGVLKGKPDALKSAPNAAVSEDVPMISALPTVKDALQDQYDALKGKYDVLKGKYEALKDGHEAPTVPAASKRTAVRKDHKHGDHAEVTCASREPDYNLDRVTRPPQEGRHFKYNPSNRGEAATVFVIDSGINEGHEEFRRNDKGIVKVLGKYVAHGKPPGEDKTHGTHCAGIIAGNNYGVAKGASVVDVQVFGEEGGSSYSTILDGMNFVMESCAGGFTSYGDGTTRRCVASMSLGGPTSSTVNSAVERMVAANIVVVVAAGNEAMNALYVSPASAPSAITVGSMGVSKVQGGDYVARYSNWGPAVDIFAPGEAIIAADAFNSNEYVRLSGTSMACPHVAGAAAILLSQHSALPASSMKETLLRLANERITGPSCSFAILQVPETTDRTLMDAETHQTCDNDFSVLLDMTSPVLVSPCGLAMQTKP
ncbi:unnamed protein product [Symbiodinium sp. CCMP2592]|nr:unnamed protein product [Symbiodinium sp. CCMP2592]